MIAALALVLPAPASGDHPDGGDGFDHAQEHELLLEEQWRAERRWGRMTMAERLAKSQAQERDARSFARSTAGDPEQVGRWSTVPFELPNYAMHAALLPTGKVLFWGYPFFDDLQNRGEAALWDPSEGLGPGAFEDVPPPMVDPDGPDGPQGTVPAPIYCSGQSFLPSGELLLSGGNLMWPFQDSRYDSAAGTDFIFTFDPWTETWAQQPSMQSGRWYPTQVLLADGTTLIAGGYSDEQPGGIDNPDVEVFVPAAERGGIGTIGSYSSAARPTELYPHLFTLPDGNVLLAGPGDLDSALLPLSQLGTGPLTWQELPKTSGYRVGGSAVLRPGSPSGSRVVTQIGGYGTVPPDSSFGPAEKSSESIDARDPLAGWSPAEPLQLGRSYHNTVLLPGGGMVTVGGAKGYSEANGNWTVDESGERRRVELLEPGDPEWSLGPAQLEDRSYHSTGLLLPDGRVWSAGDDRFPLEPDGTKSRGDTAEIYSPPYLFRGKRPVVADSARRAVFGQAFKVKMEKQGAAAERFALVAPAATTHGTDMHQRVVPLRVAARDGRSVLLQAPARAEIAPPGHYMLFALSAKGVPSTAPWVRLGF